jgi:hypothetical protein
MHKNILSTEQLNFLPFLKNFSSSFGLAGGTAIALHLGHRRSKWKDYVDLYFIIKSGISLKKIISRAEKIFGNNFNEKIFRSQLSYFKDLDYSEKVDYLLGFEITDEKIKKELTATSLEK